MRLPNKYGSIFKMGGKRRKPFAVRVTTGYTDEGKQIIKYLGSFKTRAEALAFLKEYNDNPYDADARYITFADIYKKWAAWKYKDDDISNSYISAYKWAAALHDKPFLDLRPDDLQAAVDQCEKGYSTKKNIKILCNQLYKYAMRIEITTTNYAQFIILPTATQSRAHKPFTRAEIKTLWQHTDDAGVRYALIYIYTGLRPSELLRIKRENVFIDKQYMLGGMKTAAGKNRVIPIANKIATFITDMYNFGGEYLAMSKKDKKPLFTYDRLRAQIWERSPILSKMAHLPHDGRHTCATLLSDADINKKTIQLILGHASKDITDRVYTHKTISQLIDAINKI